VAVVNAWCASGSVGHALQALNGARAKGFPLPPSAYTELLACFAAAGRLEQAGRVLAEMEAGGTPPCEAHYNALVRGCVAAGDLAGAEAVLERCHNDAQDMELVARRGGRVAPSARSYGLVVAAHAARGDVAQARPVPVPRNPVTP